MSEPLTRNKRKFPRFPMESPAQFKVLQPQSQLGDVVDERVPYVLGQSLNVSHEGLAVVVDKTLKQGDFIKLKMIRVLEPSYGSLALAEVRWCKPWAEAGKFVAGLRFLCFYSEEEEKGMRAMVQAMEKSA